MAAKTRKKPSNVWETFRNSILLLSYLVIIIIIIILLSFFVTWTCPWQISGTTGQNFMKFRPFSKWPPKHGKKTGDVWETFGNSILLLSYLVSYVVNVGKKKMSPKKGHVVNSTACFISTKYGNIVNVYRYICST